MTTFNHSPNLLEQIGDVCTQVNLSYAVFAKNHQMNANELAIFYTLWTQEQATQKYIADKYHLAKQTINSLCKRLETDGFIASDVKENNKREKVISLTDKGKAFARPIIAPLLRQEGQVIDEFGIERLVFLLNEMNALQKMLAQRLEN
ncbi:MULTISPECIES: MarR family transcriptional regulator [Gammaproteobacteria]|uniref:MarR family transcriptional regulator n=2 Tax=Gammaproteobacteria TaxID=1236 RepID=A0ABD7A7X9_9PAST|nr:MULTISPECIES: MarR family transcriptional regulator [Gammaproteobacteria]QLB42193.1 MarR family transcriptional regulator [Mannheimia pernigra]UXZ04421.1 MarR family transcriptional regulator [Moraxella nasicaprae]